MLSQIGDVALGAEPGRWVLASLVAFAAGYVQAFTGMGFAVVSTPLLVLLFGEPHQVVMLSLLLGAILGAGVLVETRKSFAIRRAWPLLAGAVLGAPVGTAVLSRADARVLTIFIAATALLAAAAWLIRPPRPARRERVVVSAAGLLGGFLNGATSMGGPPAALVVSMQRWHVGESRAALAGFNVTSYVVGLATGLTSQDIDFVVHGLWLVPTAAVGTLLGVWSVHRVPGQVFRYALLVTVWFAGLFALTAVLLEQV